MNGRFRIYNLGLLFCFVILGAWCKGEDGYEIWHRTLSPFQSHACDDEELLLQCTPNTVISVHYVQYGRPQDSEHLCPGSRIQNQGTCEKFKGALQVIHRHCHRSMMCRLHISPELFGKDNCPGTRKFVEVVYKCRPEEFLNKIVCQGSQMDLFCPSGQGLTIYSASYGTTRTGAPECLQSEGVSPDDCLIDEADETIRSLCSGRQNCSLMADDRTFGNPGCSGNKYLKVAYNCVERELLLPFPKRSQDENILTTSYPAWARGLDLSADRHFGPRVVADREGTTEAASPAISKPADMQSDEVPSDFRKSPSANAADDKEVVGFMSDWASAHKHMEGNKEKLVLYVGLSLGVGLVVFLTLLVGRFVITSHQSRRGSIPAPRDDPDDNFFSQNDPYDPPEVTIPPPPPLPPVVVHYGTQSRKDSEVCPRAPVNTGEELNHYFS